MLESIAKTKICHMSIASSEPKQCVGNDCMLWLDFGEIKVIDDTNDYAPRGFTRVSKNSIQEKTIFGSCSDRLD